MLPHPSPVVAGRHARAERCGRPRRPALQPGPRAHRGRTPSSTCVVDPGRFLARSLQAWDPPAAFGAAAEPGVRLPVPDGPVLLARPRGRAAAMGRPAAVVVAPAAAWRTPGFLRLARLLGHRHARRAAGRGRSRTRSAPRVVTELGSISVEAAAAGAPALGRSSRWCAGARGGSVRRAAACSGLAVACMGGVNAAAVARRPRPAAAVRADPRAWPAAHAAAAGLAGQPSPRRRVVVPAAAGARAVRATRSCRTSRPPA